MVVTKENGGYVLNTNFEFSIYTDGGCDPNPGGPGGYAAVILNNSTGEIQKLSGGFRSTTNNRMEIMAAAVALEHIPAGASCLVRSDSEYMINCFTGVWRRNKNTDLFARMDRAARGKPVEFQWVRGHSGVVYNEMCDKMATEARLRHDLPEDIEYVSSPDCPAWAKAKRQEPSLFGSFAGAGQTVPSGGAMSVEIVVPKKYMPVAKKKASKPSVEEYMAKYHVNRVCAVGLLAISHKKDRSFKDFMNLKTDGIDYWSGLKLDALYDGAGSRIGLERVFKKYFQDERDIITALRWYRRGLPLADCIRKVLVDKEVSQNAMRSKLR